MKVCHLYYLTQYIDILIKHISVTGTCICCYKVSNNNSSLRFISFNASFCQKNFLPEKCLLMTSRCDPAHFSASLLRFSKTSSFIFLFIFLSVYILKTQKGSVQHVVVLVLRRHVCRNTTFFFPFFFARKIRYCFLYSWLTQMPLMWRFHCRFQRAHKRAHTHTHTHKVQTRNILRNTACFLIETPNN